MKVRKRIAKDYHASRWSDGETREFLLFSDNASYADRDFLQRVSLATVELAKSDFTPLSGYRRFLTSLNGALRLPQNGGAFRMLGAFEAFEFGGRAEAKPRGKVTDFNLVFRKGEVTGGMTVAVLETGENCRLAGLFPAEAAESDALLLYCYAGVAAPRRAEKERIAEVSAYLLLSPEEGETAELPLADTELLAVAEYTTLTFAWMRQY